MVSSKMRMKALDTMPKFLLSEFRAEIQENIDNAVNSQEPAVQERFKKYFGNRIPTPEEYIYTITKKTKF